MSVEILKKSAGDSVPGSTGVDFTPSSEGFPPTVRSSPSRAARASRAVAIDVVVLPILLALLAAFILPRKHEECHHLRRRAAPFRRMAA